MIDCDRATPIAARTGRHRAIRATAAPLALILLAAAGGAADAALGSPPVWGDETSRVDVSSTGAQANGQAFSTTGISRDGRYVAMESIATNLVPGDTNREGDIFVRDRESGTTVRASVGADGRQANGPSSAPSISADGRYVVFVSSATNLVAGDTNKEQDVFLRDLEKGTTVRVSVADDGSQADSFAESAVISGDGRSVAFSSQADNLVAGDTNDAPDIFVRDLAGGVTRRVSVSSAGAQGDSVSFAPSISRDGRYVGFTSRATNLVPRDTNEIDDAFVRDQKRGTTERVNLSSDGDQAEFSSEFASVFTHTITPDGRYVTFESESANLVPGDTNELVDVFVRDRQRGITQRVSLGSGDHELNGDSGGGSMSANGRSVTFWSLEDGVVPGDTNKAADIFVRNVVRGTTRAVSVTSEGKPANGDASPGVMSSNGRAISFLSFASDVVPGDTNDEGDVFVRDRTR